MLEDECTGIGDCAAISNVDCRNDGSGLQCLCQTGYEGTAGTTTCSIVGNELEILLKKMGILSRGGE